MSYKEPEKKSLRWRLDNPDSCPYCGSSMVNHTRLGYMCPNRKCPQ